MKLSISNIAWSEEYDTQMYRYLQNISFDGLEIAPTRILKDPYDHIASAKSFAENLKKEYNLEIPSMQSIWFGRNERVFGTVDERQRLIEYTKKAIDFAGGINCKNLVFGSPKNRVIDDDGSYDIAVEFFRELAQYAAQKGTVLSIEPTPTIYGTNFINYTQEAFDLAKTVDSKGFKVNVDFGTIIQNDEGIAMVADHMDLVNHIHISEPYLVQIEKREGHKELASILKQKEYGKFVSIEMKKLDNMEEVKKTAEYVKGVFA